MGFFKLEETEPKPVQLSVNMESEIEAKNLIDLAKHLCWIDERIPAHDREVTIRTHYYDQGYTVTVKWKEVRE